MEREDPPPSNWLTNSLNVANMALVVIVLVTAYFVGEPIYRLSRFRHAYGEALDRVGSLESRRPPAVDPQSWESAVGWARTVTANMSWDESYENIAAWESLARDYDERLGDDDPIDLATIDWIWDRLLQMKGSKKDYLTRNRQVYLDELNYHRRAAGLPPHTPQSLPTATP